MSRTLVMDWASVLNVVWFKSDLDRPINSAGHLLRWCPWKCTLSLRPLSATSLGAQHSKHSIYDPRWSCAVVRSFTLGLWSWKSLIDLLISLLQTKDITELPKVLLHDHVDGGLRPQNHYRYCAANRFGIAVVWSGFITGKYLCQLQWRLTWEILKELWLHHRDYAKLWKSSSGFRECVIDLALDGVVYAEVRGAPELFTQGGLTISQVIEATLQGISEGVTEAQSLNRKIETKFIACAMRHTNRSLEVAETILKFREKGLVGFDIAGAESGFQPAIIERHLICCMIKVFPTQFTPVKQLPLNLWRCNQELPRKRMVTALDWLMRLI